MFHEIWQLERFKSAKVTFRVIQGAIWCLLVPLDKPHTIFY